MQKYYLQFAAEGLCYFFGFRKEPCNFHVRMRNSSVTKIRYENLTMVLVCFIVGKGS